jgi:hypothetical protein
LPALELLEGDVDARVPQSLQGRLHPLLADARFELALAPAGVEQHRAVGAVLALVDELPGDEEEVVVAATHPLPQRVERGGPVDRAL